MSNLGLWAEKYAEGKPFPYGSETTYGMGAMYLADCETVHDWGCGAQWFREVARIWRHDMQVTGIDGSPGCCDVVSELAEITPPTLPDGVFMRHVLEHNIDWRDILQNALRSFRQKMMLIVSVPIEPVERLIYLYRFPAGGACPVLALPGDEIDALITAAGATFTRETLLSPGTEFSVETIWRIQRGAT